MQRTKILYLIGTLDVGGTEGQLVDLVTRLDRERFLPVVACLSSAGPLEGRLKAEGTKVEVIGLQGGGFSPFRALASLLEEVGRLITCFRAELPDIVHGFLFGAYVLGTFAARRARVPVVLSSRRGLGLSRQTNPTTSSWNAWRTG